MIASQDLLIRRLRRWPPSAVSTGHTHDRLTAGCATFLLVVDSLASVNLPGNLHAIHQAVAQACDEIEEITGRPKKAS